MPANFQEPSHALLEETARADKWAVRLSRWKQLAVMPLSWYCDLFLGLGFRVDAWQTTYEMVLQGEDAVYEWVKGTSLQPVLNLLTVPEREEFREEYAAKLRDFYPAKDYGTIYPFTRIFFVASRPDGSQPAAG
jgi:trans-aconitate 2-methyltransferase